MRTHHGAAESQRLVTPLRPILLIVLVGVPLWGVAQPVSQDQEPVPRIVYSPRDRTLEISGGMTLPLSHAGLKEFWLRGPSVGVGFLFRANDLIRYGIGGEVAQFSFRRGAFAERFPDVIQQVTHLTGVYLFLALRNYLRPGLRMSPFIGAEVGILRMTGAEYKAVINGVRRTYYEIPAMSHLAASVSAGLDYYVSRTIALQVQGRVMYVFNDPDTGLLVAIHAGVRFSL